MQRPARCDGTCLLVRDRHIHFKIAVRVWLEDMLERVPSGSADALRIVIRILGG